MKNFLKLTLLASAFAFAAGIAYAGSNTAKIHFDSGGTQLTADNGAKIDTHGMIFTTVPTQNPLTQVLDVDVTPASAGVATTGYQFLSGVASRTIYPGQFSVMVSGTAAGATSLLINCYPSLKKLATFPIANLVTSVPVTPSSSTAITAGAVLAQGCASGDGIAASVVGSALTTTTDIFINMPYTIQ